MLLSIFSRYTREWLSAMTVAKIIHLDRESGLYLLPEAHKQDIQLRASFASVVFVLSNRKDLLKNCFKEDGPYGRVTFLYTSVLFSLSLSFSWRLSVPLSLSFYLSLSLTHPPFPATQRTVVVLVSAKYPPGAKSLLNAV